jgi:uncharacterized membrane protein YjgN (DUF898 family)
MDTVPVEYQPAAPAPASRSLDIRFTGSGSEYFRIWIVNLLLIVVTLGFYLPFAKARRIHYFYANTFVDGQALSFHGDPWKMFRGFVLLVVLMGLYLGLSWLSPLLGALAFLALLLLWPPLWRAGMRFRLSHTSWRGLRFGFAGDVAGAYGVFLPIGVPLLLVALVPENAGVAVHGLAALAGLLVNLMVPWALGRAKQYQHNHYRFADQQTRTWMASTQVYGLSFRAGAVGTVLVILAGIVTAIMLPSLRGSADGYVGLAGVGLVYFAAYIWVSSAFTAGLQNLVWSSTASNQIRFQSDLSVMALARLTLVNWLLMMVTLGLYRPFAAVATARLRLEAVAVHTTADIDAWAGSETARDANAAGDFAGDFFGIDLGL